VTSIRPSLGPPHPAVVSWKPGHEKEAAPETIPGSHFATFFTLYGNYGKWGHDSSPVFRPNSSTTVTTRCKPRNTPGWAVRYTQGPDSQFSSNPSLIAVYRPPSFRMLCAGRRPRSYSPSQRLHATDNDGFRHRNRCGAGSAGANRNHSAK
jgi:hypothetical protein